MRQELIRLETRKERIENMPPEKNIDESWKDSVESERKHGDLGKEMPHKSPLEPDAVAGDPEGSADAEIPEVNFISYITSLAFQVMIFLGEIPNPVTNATEKNLVQAKLSKTI